MTQTRDLIKKMAEFFKSEEYFEKGEDARLELSPEDVRCMNRLIHTVNLVNSSSEKPNKWIPVGERLPETTDYYLVTVGMNEYGLMIPSVRTALYNAKTKDFTVHTGTNMCIVGDVIAWRDCLPQPYQPEIQTGSEGSDKE